MDSSIGGGKYQGLEKLRQAGFPVPAYFLVSAERDVAGLAEDPGWQEYIGHFPEDQTFAVRSSARGEDGENYSFAGLFQTYLQVPFSELSDRIRACRLSGQSRAVQTYKDRNKLDDQETRVDVIVQAMVDAEQAGVLFTAHPDGLLSEMVLQVGDGLGKGIVDGAVPVTDYYYNPAEQTGYYETSPDSPLLTEEVIRRLWAAGEKARELFGPALDLEFAIRAGQVYFLQMRPITTLAEGPEIILDNSNIVESYPGITLPLSLDLARIAYEGVFTGLSHRILGEKRSEELADLLQNMIQPYHGRLYYQISNWYRALQFLPQADRIIPVWQDMLGVQNRQVSGAKVKLGPMETLAAYRRILRQLLTVDRQMQALDQEFQKLWQRFQQEFHEGMTRREIRELFTSLRLDLLAHWDITLVNDLYTFLFTGKVRKLLGESKGKSLSNQALAGLADLASLEPVRALARLADTARAQGIDSQAYKAEQKQFIDLYGDRGPAELKLETRTFRADPALLENEVRYFAAHPELLANRLQALASAKGDGDLPVRAEGGGLKKRRIRFYQKRAQKGIRNRELSRFHRTRIYGMVRAMADELGKNLVGEGYLDQVSDIYYLDFAMAFHPEGQEVREVVKARKERYMLYQVLPTYNRLIFRGRVAEKYHRTVNGLAGQAGDGDLKGQACANGRVTGEVVIIHDPTQNLDVTGKIIVTKLTDPGWVYLLLQAKGLITEKGSLLSHTGIISRELGLPAVTGVYRATEILKTGERITLDGATGEIIREKRISL